MAYQNGYPGGYSGQGAAIVTGPRYDIIAVARVPNQATGPTLTEIGPVYGSLIFREAVDWPGEATLTINTNTLSDGMKSRLRDLAALPTEIWIYREGVKVFAGPIFGGEIVGMDTITITIPGLLAYLDYMLVTTDTVFAATEQFTIARTLVDDWQDLDYGNYGIDVTAVTTSGITRDYDIPGTLEPSPVLEHVLGLGAADDGYDVSVNPITREMDLAWPKRGTDLSASVFLERGLASANVRFSVAPGLIASEVFLTATSEGNAALTATAVNTGLRASWGRAGYAVAVDNIKQQAMADDLALAYKDARAEGFFQPGLGLFPIVGAAYTDFAVGDTVTYSYDAGVGTQSGSYRVISREVTLGDDGTEVMSVEFE